MKTRTLSIEIAHVYFRMSWLTTNIEGNDGIIRCSRCIPLICIANASNPFCVTVAGTRPQFNIHIDSYPRPVPHLRRRISIYTARQPLVNHPCTLTAPLLNMFARNCFYFEFKVDALYDMMDVCLETLFSCYFGF